MPECPFCAKLGRLADLAVGELVWEFPHSVALLGPWQRYAGYCILVARTHATELHRLAEPERRVYLEEMCVLAQAMETAFLPRKLNYELLGNQVPHLHWHLFPRPHDDDDLLRPVWFAVERAERDEAERARLQSGPIPRTEITARLREQIRKLAGPSR